MDTVYIYDLSGCSCRFLVLFFNECKCAWKMYQYEKVPHCMYWDNSVGAMLETSVS